MSEQCKNWEHDECMDGPGLRLPCACPCHPELTPYERAALRELLATTPWRDAR